MRLSSWLSKFHLPFRLMSWPVVIFTLTDSLGLFIPKCFYALYEVLLHAGHKKWIFDNLTNRLQYVWLYGLLSSVICTNTGAPQGTVLAPFLFSLYTADGRSTDVSRPLVKFADDTELVGKISNNEDALYYKQIKNFRIGVIKMTSIWMRCVLTLGRIKDVPNQSALKEKQWRG